MTVADRVRAGLTHRWLVLALVLAACVLAAPALRGGFQLDDHFQRLRLLGHGGPSIQLFVFARGDAAENLRAMDEGWMPWWASPHFRHASLRYLSVLTMQLDFALWPDRPELMHLHSLLWLAAVVAAAAYFYRTILGPTWVAGLASLLYVLDDAHARPAGYLAGRNALIATFFGLLAGAWFVRRRQTDERLAWGSAACFALGLAAGEMALAAAAYFVAYALFLDRASAARRIRALAPHAAVLIVWLSLYRLGGFGATDSGFYREPLADPVAYARVAWGNILALMLGQWTPVPADLGSGVVPGSAAALALRWMGIATVAVVCGLLAPLVRRDRTARFFALGAGLALLPIAATGPQNRLLFYVGFGSMGLLAQLVAAFSADPGVLPSSRWWRVPAWTVTVLFLGTHLVLSPVAAPLSLEFDRRVNEKMVTAIASVPADPAIAEQDLILVNPPDFVYTVGAIAPVKRLDGLPTARRVRALAGAPTAMEVTRADLRSLRVRLADGLFNVPMTRYYRAPEARFAVGDRVDLTGFSAEIADRNAAGDPDELIFRFAVPLEDASLRWLAWRDGVYAPWQPPALGATIRLPAPKGIYD